MTEIKKKIIFTVTQREKEDFKIRLHYDNLTQANFFRGVIKGYLEKDENFLTYLNTFKKNNGIQNNIVRHKIIKDIHKAKNTKNLFALEDKEVDSIFDILESEHPDL